MKRILIHLTDEEYEQLLRIKGQMTWKDLLLSMIPKSHEDLLVEKVNDFFGELKELDPDNEEFYELIRVFLILYIRRRLEKALNIMERAFMKLREKKG